MHSNWYLMTTTMPLCFTICILLSIMQQRSLKWYSNVIESDIFKKRKELFCLYGLYLMGACCAAQCFLCHVSNLFPQWYCVYGMSICVILYAATKTFLYGFFLERAKCAQSTDFMLPKVVKNYILPVYIVAYFVLYLVLCPLTFRGEVIDKSEINSIPTACIFGEFHPWVFAVGAGVDVFNSIFFLFLFAYPLCDAVRQKEHFTDSEAHQKLRRELLTAIKWNIYCSSICSVSSVSFLFIMSYAKNNDIGYYLWFGGNVDIMINSVCIFLMVGANRQYVLYLSNKMPAPPKTVKDDNVHDANEIPKLEDNNSMEVVSKRTISELTTNSVVSTTQNGNINTSIKCDFGHVQTVGQRSSEIVFEMQTNKSENDSNDGKTIVVVAND